MTGTTTTSTTAGARTVPGRGAPDRWAVLVVLCASLLLIALDSTVLHVAVPAVSEDLRPSAVQLLWIVDAYPLVAASLLILFGTLGDRVGRRRLLLLGYALFGGASALAAFAPNPGALITARALLGVGGAMVMPATLSILRSAFPDRRERAVAIGAWSAVAASGAAVGPLLGGFLVEHAWWGAVFLINVPLMAVALPLGHRLLPESTGDREGPWDVLGVLIATTGILGLVLGVKQAGDGVDPTAPGAVVPFLAGLVLLAVFVSRQSRREHPLVDPRLFTRPAFGTAVCCIVLAMLALVGLALLAVQYLQLVLGLPPLRAGLRLLPLTVSAVAAGLVGSRLLRRLGPRAMAVVGFCLTATAVLALTGVGHQDRPWLLTGCFLLLGFGIQTTLFAAYESLLNDAPAGQAGGAAAIGETSYQLGAGLGVAVLGSVMNAAYAPAIRDTPGVPPESRAAAKRSIGEAYEVADTLPGDAGPVLRSAARTAFVHGLRVALLVSAGLLLLGALAALRLPRTFDPAHRSEPHDLPDRFVPERLGGAAAGPVRTGDPACAADSDRPDPTRATRARLDPDGRSP
ncbi:MFS transporter [Wenjunlia vitaminophila]|uniref:MFS transporter n=1 Tax=Wenjunlia vitaminophila TaxID=76728 RepID=UPI00035EF3D3|nr:MFS transporter [Wenjunlia vitaminophila]